MKSSGTENNGYAQVEPLRELLTHQQVAKFVKKAVPELKMGQTSLQQSLENKQWKVATKQAHRLKSAISLLSAHSLVSSLDLIESGNDSKVQTPEFRALVISQCQQLVDGLEHYLANN